MSDKTSLIEQIEQLDFCLSDAYFESLEEALRDYKKMVESGILIPRGNRAPGTVITKGAYNCGKNI